MADIQATPVDEAFVHAVRDALTYLYDWVKLHHSHLVQTFNLEREEDPGFALREALSAAIEHFKPGPEVPTKARAWRIYNLLYARYVEQFTQAETATELGLSIRHLRREETFAVEAVATYLWKHYAVRDRWPALADAPAHGTSEPAGISAPTPDRLEELAWMQRSFPSEVVDVEQLVQELLPIAHSAISASDLRIECHAEAGLPRAIVQRPALRQALLSLLTVAARLVRQGDLNIGLTWSGPNVRLDFTGGRAQTELDLAERDVEQIEMARQLLELSGGRLEIDGDAAEEMTFSVRVVVPAEQQVPVLVIDDNLDTLQLLERYLTGTRYQFVGTADPREVLRLVEEARPAVVVLDVMLPEVDGWELLGRLRQHPLTQTTPVIVCTILPHEQLALDLGATAFLRKPLSREQLLATLDRQSGRTATTPD